MEVVEEVVVGDVVVVEVVVVEEVVVGALVVVVVEVVEVVVVVVVVVVIADAHTSLCRAQKECFTLICLSSSSVLVVCMRLASEDRKQVEVA